MDYPKTLIYAVGAFAAIAVVGFLGLDMGLPMLIASFGASTVILFAMPDSRAARPRNVFFGHVLSATVAFLLYALLGCTWYALAIGVALAIVIMVVTDTVHPPGGATVIACITASPSWTFIVAPVALGAVLLIAIASVTGMAYRRYLLSHPSA